MFTSGTKKGLAGSAVTALAVAGLPLLAGPAGAVTHTSTLGADEVDLVSPVATTVSAKPDGQNATQRLTAIGGSNVTGVRFEYRIGSGPWTLIANQISYFLPGQAPRRRPDRPTAGLYEGFAHNSTTDIGESKIPPLVTIGQARVIEAKAMQNRGLNVVHMSLILDTVVSQFIRLANYLASLNPATCHQ